MKLKLKIFNHLPPWSILFLRIVIGSAFAISGWGKLQHLDKIVEYFTSLHIPFASIQAPMVAGLEFAGGLLLIFGLGTRVISLLLTGTMFVALITAIVPELESKVDVFSSIELVYLAVLIHLFCSGAGCLSLDHVLAKKFCKESC